MPSIKASSAFCVCDEHFLRLYQCTFFSVWDNPKDLFSKAWWYGEKFRKFPQKLDGKIDFEILLSLRKSNRENATGHTPIPNKKRDWTTEVVHFHRKKNPKQPLRLRMWSTTTFFSRESDKNAAEEEENPVWARCLKITEKVSFNLASEASYVNIDKS